MITVKNNTRESEDVSNITKVVYWLVSKQLHNYEIAIKGGFRTKTFAATGLVGDPCDIGMHHEDGAFRAYDSVSR
uniref:Uncharacterized protein n=1 Tax=Romanomermis culicivorax TaxID=13658 RepID=A0A915HXS2_ROMCU